LLKEFYRSGEFNGCRVSVWEDEKSGEGGDCYTTMQMDLMTQNYIPESG
jgi:hypothetical protein